MAPRHGTFFLRIFPRRRKLEIASWQKKKNRGESMTRENAEMNPVRDKDEG